jgi:hypothetical protein
MSDSLSCRRRTCGVVARAAAVMAMLQAAGLAIAASPEQPAAAAGAAVAVPAPPSNGELGFVFSTFGYAVYPGMADNCPEGYANTISENYMASLSPAEHARLSRPENEKEYDKNWKAYARGPNNTNLCTNYDQFPDRPLQKLLQGKTAYGVDLDGDDGRGAKLHDTCPHQSFVSPDGEPGVDNQSYRAMGCIRGWRAPDGSPGDVMRYQQERVNTGEYTTVLLLRGVQSLLNDDDVEVILASSLDRPILDMQAHFVTGATYKISDNPRWRNVLHGHIHNGILTTDEREIVVRQPVYDGEKGPRLARTEWIFHHARLRLAIQPDGSLQGVVGGYMAPLLFFDRGASSGVGATDIVNYDCASSYNTLLKLADGGRDPKTGQCTTISTAFLIKAVAAYVNDTHPAKTAAAK